MKHPHYLVTTLLTSARLFALTACEEPRVDACICASIEQCMGDPLLPKRNVGAALKKHKTNMQPWPQNMRPPKIAKQILGQKNASPLL